GRRWEIDVMGLRGTDLVCFDCKQWKTWGKESAVLRSAEEHASRVEALSRVQAKPKDFEAVWNAVKIYPALVTLLDIDRRVSAGCFVVPVSNLNSFLDDFYDLRGLVKPFKAEAVEENPRRG
ncbi:MAG: hypothetical protein JTT11_06640, partial [Candidatus Brockarchaeota archaeon]|nr:hypothetical protein [Candidatus Brockarchaeota archaeon]